MYSTESPEERGKRSEARFFEAASVILPQTPPWLIAIEKAPSELDLRGVDAIAYITYPGEHHVERVPIQIKSSWHAVTRYLEKHEHRRLAVPVFIVMLDRLTPHDVRRILYSRLRKIRDDNVRFNDYFAQQYSSRLSLRAEETLQRLLRARMRIPHTEKVRPLGHQRTQQYQRPMNQLQRSLVGLIRVLRSLVQRS